MTREKRGGGFEAVLRPRFASDLRTSNWFLGRLSFLPYPGNDRAAKDADKDTSAEDDQQTTLTAPRLVPSTALGLGSPRGHNSHED